jgi:hypothetical protein
MGRSCVCGWPWRLHSAGRPSPPCRYCLVAAYDGDGASARRGQGFTHVEGARVTSCSPIMWPGTAIWTTRQCRRAGSNSWAPANVRGASAISTGLCGGLGGLRVTRMRTGSVSTNRAPISRSIGGFVAWSGAEATAALLCACHARAAIRTEPSSDEPANPGVRCRSMSARACTGRKCSGTLNSVNDHRLLKRHGDWRRPSLTASPISNV